MWQKIIQADGLVSQIYITTETPSTEKRQSWRVAIRKEFKDMIRQGVWDVIERSSIPEARRLLGSKWVFKEKRDGRFRARLVCLGYSQIPSRL